MFFTIKLFCNIHQRTNVLESLFNKVAGLPTPTQVLSCEYYEILKNSFFYRTFSLATSMTILLQERLFEREVPTIKC